MGHLSDISARSNSHRSVIHLSGSNDSSLAICAWFESGLRGIQSVVLTMGRLSSPQHQIPEYTIPVQYNKHNKVAVLRRPPELSECKTIPSTTIQHHDIPCLYVARVSEQTAKVLSPHDRITKAPQFKANQSATAIRTRLRPLRDLVRRLQRHVVYDI